MCFVLRHFDNTHGARDGEGGKGERRRRREIARAEELPGDGEARTGVDSPKARERFYRKAGIWLSLKRQTPSMDFVNVIEPEMSLKILSCLDDPSDFVRASAVSHSWRDFVIRHGLCKNLCLRMFSQLSLVDHVNVIEEGSKEKESSEAESSNLMEWKLLEKEHLAYAFLARGCTSFPVESCISEAISSSGKNLSHTLESQNWDHGRALCWISRGHQQPAAGDFLLYKLVSDLCAVTEINIRAFEARTGGRRRVFSARYVRFRIGHRKTGHESEQASVGSKFVWTYTSEMFPMAQVRSLQSFKLPKPVVCLDGCVLVELLGCSERSISDGLYHICISYVKVMGRSLSDNFKVRALDASGRFALDYERYPRSVRTEDDIMSQMLRDCVLDIRSVVSHVLL
ncbi:PREDICTED: F-box protein At4g00755-like isoform X2 [Tarenaya hassleriana]|uniref:F-box protein At4g00755-like isoform X2 n=1 Tax=Tarenaya hassleriana TaxID=28532 RepID=UPI00053C0BA4|nr:PREDICTED: F-box protein At4g00755-like isoform X2 [Tarenaya hassleriana]